MTKKLYQYTREIWLTQEDQGVLDMNDRLTVNFSMIDSDFKVHKNSRADVQFVIRNTDRKPINLVGKSLTAYITNYDNGETVLEKPLHVIDEYKGIAKILFNAEDTSELALGFYHYSVHITDENDFTYPLYVDLSQNARSYFELMDQLVPKARPIIELNPAKFTPVSYGYQPQLGNGDTRMVSGAQAGDTQVNFIGNPEHHITVYADNFSGKVYMQYNDEANITSMENVDQQDWSDWKFIELDNVNETEGFSFINQTGTTNFIVNKSFKWWRIMIEPHPRNDGKIYKITHEIKRG